MSFVGKGFGVLTRLLKKWGSGCEHKIQICTRRRERVLFLAGTRRLKLLDVIQKRVIHSSAHPVSMLQELHNKVRALKNYITKVLGLPTYTLKGRDKKCIE